VSTSIRLMREITRPVDKELLYGLLYDVYTLFLEMKPFGVTRYDPSLNEISVVWVERRFILEGATVAMRVRAEAVDENTIVIHFDSDMLKARLIHRLEQLQRAVRISIDASCESRRMDLCVKVLNEYMGELEKVTRKPVKPAIQPPVKPGRVQAVEAPLIQQPKEPVKPREEIDVARLLDEAEIAMLLLNAELLEAGEVKPPWSISSLIGRAREMKDKLTRHSIVLITVKDTEGVVDVKILLDKDGNPLGYYGYMEGRVVKDASGNLAPLEKALSAREAEYRIWGSKHAP